MFALNSVSPAVFETVKAHRIPEYFLTAFRVALLLTLDGVVIDAEHASDPRVLIERDSDGYFFQVEYPFKLKGSECSYTFQITVKPGAALIGTATQQLMPMLGVHVMEPEVSIGLSAKRNGLVYYEFGTSGTIQETTVAMSRALS